jgi:hypothetical protein
MGLMRNSTIIQMILEQFKDHLNDKELALLEGLLEGIMEGVSEGIKEYKEIVLNDLLTVFDEQIGKEQQERSDVLKNTGGEKGCAWWAHNGRVDGVDTGRALVERYFASKESSDE